MVKCRSCGYEVSENSRFCSSCGGAIASEVTQTVAAPVAIPASRSGDKRASIGAKFTAETAAESRFVPGDVLAGRYRIVALLGRGGMGEVYRADDLTLSQPVALKFLPEAFTTNADSVTRFRNEVRIARQVSHPNVCRVFDIGETDDRFFLSMEYVDGEDLGSLLRRIGRLPGDKAIEIARGLCAGLAAAHEKGVLHRDLKPANVMLDGRGHVLLTDFGLAALAHQVDGGEVRSGTPAYMAPEQLSGKEVTVRSDLYSLGLVLYEIFTGKRPFEATTLADLVRARTETAPTNPSTLVRDLDPAVERVILRCLEAEPSHRPSSALAVSAALPGGDPLAAALAAGETPSPEMVAAAGEGAGLAPRIAIPVLAASLIGLAVSLVLAARSSGLEQIRPPYSAEVLSQKARDAIQRLGYEAAAADDASGFSWDSDFAEYVEKNDKPIPRWKNVLSQRPLFLRFWYRQSNYPLIGTSFSDDLLTPGVVFRAQPPFTRSGMITLDLDAQGRLIDFEALPKQMEEPAKQNPAFDWDPLFALAGLDRAKFQPTESLWTSLAASDTRVAWTGTWPESARPLRVEAAGWRGKPVFFSLIGPWTKPGRMPPLERPAKEQIPLWIAVGLGVMVCVSAPLLARRNLVQGKGDRRGAVRLAAFIFFVQMALWLSRGHFAPAIGIAAIFFLAICTSVFYAAVIWTLYVAIEPYVRRYWPQALISWTRVLAGHFRDPIVGRDVLLGTALGVSWKIIDGLLNLATEGSGSAPGWGETRVLLGVRATIANWIMQVPGSVRTALAFFFLLFLLRVFLRNRWLAVAGFILIFTVINVAQNSDPIPAIAGGVLVYGMVAVIGVRLGLLAMAVAIFVDALLSNVPVTMHLSAWYFANDAFLIATVIGLAIWACFAALAGQRIWKQDLFG